MDDPLKLIERFEAVVRPLEAQVRGAIQVFEARGKQIDAQLQWLETVAADVAQLKEDMAEIKKNLGLLVGRSNAGPLH